jgi:hypothetical protein
MKFTLEIELGNDAMRSHQDIRDALTQVMGKVGARQYCVKSAPSDGDGSKIIDDNGNSVGTWQVLETATRRTNVDASQPRYFVQEPLVGLTSYWCIVDRESPWGSDFKIAQLYDDAPNGKTLVTELCDRLNGIDELKAFANVSARNV